MPFASGPLVPICIKISSFVLKILFIHSFVCYQNFVNKQPEKIMPPLASVVWQWDKNLQCKNCSYQIK